jgi:hypothetical protein
MTTQIRTICVDRNPFLKGTAYRFVTASSEFATHIVASFELHHVPSHRRSGFAQGLSPR